MNSACLLISVLLVVGSIGCAKDGDAATRAVSTRDGKKSGAAVSKKTKVEAQQTAVAISKKTKIKPEKAKALKALGYFDRAETQNPTARDVTISTPKAYKGFNLYNSRHRAEAYLTDMAGKILHTWRAPEGSPPWMYARMMPNGDILAIAKSSHIIRLDWNSKVVWRRIQRAHHDVTVDEAGNIYVLTHKPRDHTHNGARLPIMDDAIVKLSPDGTILRKRYLFSALKPLVSVGRLARIQQQLQKGVRLSKLMREGAPSDVLHTNSLQILERTIDGIAPKGSVLLSVREINRVVILSENLKRVLWHWGAGELQGQHHAVHLENGNISIFDNGVRRKHSRVIEMNPQTGDIVWTYEHPDFFSRLRGSAQQQPGGNMLITESDGGHVFEVTRDGEMVWEFWNPDVVGSEEPTRAVIYRLMRYPLDYLDDTLLPASS